MEYKAKIREMRIGDQAVFAQASLTKTTYSVENKGVRDDVTFDAHVICQ